MKKLNYFFALLFLFTAFTSCNKRNMEARLEAMPEYTGTAIPIVNVGNTSCEDLEGEYIFSTGRVNYVNGTFDFSDVNSADWPEGVDPVTGWPNGLSVTVSEDGRYVSFTYESDNYCVGAIIVKGGNSSNVYTYDPAVKTDVNLSSPVNASGLPAGLSNLTFCFVECKAPVELVVGLKSYMTGNEDTHVTTGEFITAYPLVLGGKYPIYLWGGASAQFLVGYLTVTDSNADGYWEVTADNSVRTEFQYIEPFLYVGPASGFNLDFRNYPYPNPKVTLNPPMDAWTFVLPFTLP